MGEKITAVLDQIEAEAEAAQPVGRTALELHQEVYRDRKQPLHLRLRAAQNALPYETPKLAVVGNYDGRDLGEMLDRAIARSLARENVNPKLIEHDPEEQ
jgi:hypothetical protein